ncbi:MAG: glycosyltransferase [Kiritimatiellae bacterium]|nr:glycosyltransferase [Kiritimatiellia bacterium]MDD4736731.1 glycosyltransferase [Kiritimatiellia bacterium]
MRVLFISNRLPYAGVTGGYSIIHQRIEGLCRRGHEVGLATFQRSETPEQVEAMRALLFELELVEAPRDRHLLRRLFDYFFLPIPSRFRSCRSLAMKRCIGEMVERSHYDVVIAEFARMGQHLYRNPYLPAVRRVVSSHRSLSLLHQNEIKYLGWGPAGLFQRLRMKGMESFEFMLYRNADHVLVLSPEERYWMQLRIPGVRISVVAGGVDTTFFSMRTEPAKEPVIIFTGSYRDRANEDAMLWFLKSSWPLLKEREPAARLLIVGPGVTPAIHAVAVQDTSVEITGYVDDLRPYLHRARVFVCPIRLGAGIRTKLLEAMAAGVPVVSTALGVEGLPVQVGDNCFLADQPVMMVEYIHLLLQDDALADSMAGRARKMIEERFMLDSTVIRLEQTLNRIVGH